MAMRAAPSAAAAAAAAAVPYHEPVEGVDNDDKEEVAAGEVDVRGGLRPELVRLKLEMDAMGDYHSLHKLLFKDMAASSRTLEHRDAILVFFRDQGELFLRQLDEESLLLSRMRRSSSGRRKTVTASMTTIDSTSMRDDCDFGLLRRPWRKVLSDIDDTLKCSGGKFPAGTDQSLPRKAIYPGVGALPRARPREYHGRRT